MDFVLKKVQPNVNLHFSDHSYKHYDTNFLKNLLTYN